MPSTSNGVSSTNSQSVGNTHLNGNLRDGNISSPLPLSTAAAAATAAATSSGANATLTASQTGAIVTEIFQLAAPLLWEEFEKLTEEQQKERDKVNFEKLKFTGAALYSSLRLKDPYR